MGGATDDHSVETFLLMSPFIMSKLFPSGVSSNSRPQSSSASRKPCDESPLMVRGNDDDQEDSDDESPAADESDAMTGSWASTLCPE